eukprot:CAMPEP_0194424452 /NCGR_PEP_ID=MMETSP0176-20130528/23729_1 /TAXON_ID=216777 /ORGANISM="Proboscia alata, Strain PI-D3" /LENGTH=62 /DNA_ID=CAMNT_0039234225 /DNA_START=79 /DNA_END=263 /DNA_ORIENTATION=+
MISSCATRANTDASATVYTSESPLIHGLHFTAAVTSVSLPSGAATLLGRSLGDFCPSTMAYT